jgi:ankyrin repeat protein
VKSNNQSHVERILLYNRSSIHYPDLTGRTPLSHAAESRNEQIVKLLLDTGDSDINTLDINTLDNEGRTPLSYAAENGRGNIVKLLLETKQY